MGSQYLVDFELDCNDKEPGKIQKGILHLVKRLPAGSLGYRITADNLFNSVDTCRKIRELGHCLTTTSASWHGTTARLQCVSSNIHPPVCVLTSRQMKGLADRTELNCPLAFAEYNASMGAIDNFDQLLSFMWVKLLCMKWWHAIFYFLIHLALVNVLHLWRAAHIDSADSMDQRV
eukprot:3701515-Rhodomonas_salina.2